METGNRVQNMFKFIFNMQDRSAKVVCTDCLAKTTAWYHANTCQRNIYINYCAKSFKKIVTELLDPNGVSIGWVKAVQDLPGNSRVDILGSGIPIFSWLINYQLN